LEFTCSTSGQSLPLHLPPNYPSNPKTLALTAPVVVSAKQLLLKKIKTPKGVLIHVSFTKKAAQSGANKYEPNYETNVEGIHHDYLTADTLSFNSR
jgi:hypothetical protein